MDGVSRKVFAEGFKRVDEDEGGEIACGRSDTYEIMSKNLPRAVSSAYMFLPTAFSAKASRASRSRVKDDALPSAAFSRSRFLCAWRRILAMRSL